MEPRSRLIALAGTDDARSLAEGALWIAAEAHPGLDVSHWLARLDALGYRAADRVTSEMDVDRAAAAVSRFLFEDEGFRGNADGLLRPPQQLPRRRAGASSASRSRSRWCTWLSSTRAGLEAFRRGAAGALHRARQCAAAGDRLLDPFHGGRLLDRAGGEALLARVRPGGGPLDLRWLAPVTTRQIFVRMLSNLKATYSALGDWARALAAAERIVLLLPDALEEIRDRGTLHARLGHGHAAARDWEAYLQGAPQAPDAGQVKGRLVALRQALSALN